MSRRDDLRRFYSILDELRERLGGFRCLRECHGRQQWPSHGVYFFFEGGEVQSSSGTGLRVVRVGTHALASGGSASLWSRLSAHRGSADGSTGHHRGSIFRLLVGEALIRRDELHVASWGVGSSPGAAARKIGVTRESLKEAEDPIERAVSATIGAMPVLWVRTDPPDHELRATLERESLALLSNHCREALDPPSATWLGSMSSRRLVRESGLWNNDHVEKAHDPGFLDLLERAVRRARVGG